MKASSSTKALDRVKRDLATARRKLAAAEKKHGLVDVSWCQWCKRAGRTLYNSHDSDDCWIKHPQKNKHKKRKP
jgi:hypothetical protein